MKVNCKTITSQLQTSLAYINELKQISAWQNFTWMQV